MDEVMFYESAPIDPLKQALIERNLANGELARLKRDWVPYWWVVASFAIGYSAGCGITAAVFTWGNQ